MIPSDDAMVRRAFEETVAWEDLRNREYPIESRRAAYHAGGHVPDDCTDDITTHCDCASCAGRCGVHLPPGPKGRVCRDCTELHAGGMTGYLRGLFTQAMNPLADEIGSRPASDDGSMDELETRRAWGDR